MVDEAAPEFPDFARLNRQSQTIQAVVADAHERIADHIDRILAPTLQLASMLDSKLQFVREADAYDRYAG